MNKHYEFNHYFRRECNYYLSSVEHSLRLLFSDCSKFEESLWHSKMLSFADRASTNTGGGSCRLSSVTSFVAKRFNSRRGWLKFINSWEKIGLDGFYHCNTPEMTIESRDSMHLSSVIYVYMNESAHCYERIYTLNRFFRSKTHPVVNEPVLRKVNLR
jgi:hypothetical protein